jgi:hypothetical protein
VEAGEGARPPPGRGGPAGKCGRGAVRGGARLGAGRLLRGRAPVSVAVAGGSRAGPGLGTAAAWGLARAARLCGRLPAEGTWPWPALAVGPYLGPKSR